MTINDQIRDENIRYNIYREAAKISALSSVEIRKFESLTGEDILPSNQQKIREQEKLVILLLEKLLKKKTIEDQEQKQVDDLKVLEPKVIKSGSNNKSMITYEIVDKINEIEWMKY